MLIVLGIASNARTLHVPLGADRSSAPDTDPLRLTLVLCPVRIPRVPGSLVQAGPLHVGRDYGSGGATLEGAKLRQVDGTQGRSAVGT